MAKEDLNQQAIEMTMASLVVADETEEEIDGSCINAAYAMSQFYGKDFDAMRYSVWQISTDDRDYIALLAEVDDGIKLLTRATDLNTGEVYLPTLIYGVVDGEVDIILVREDQYDISFTKH